MKKHGGRIILGGEFNAILHADDKIGGLGRMGQVKQDFANLIINGGLTDIVPSNGKYTWMNRRTGLSNIAERLDRFLISDDWNVMNV